jgi:hypothetical protein
MLSFSTGKKRAFEKTNGKSNTLYLLYPDFTVGIGISPIQLLQKSRSWTITTGRELHPAPEDEPYIYNTSIIIHKKSQLTNFLCDHSRKLFISLVFLIR